MMVFPYGVGRYAGRRRLDKMTAAEEIARWGKVALIGMVASAAAIGYFCVRGPLPESLPGPREYAVSIADVNSSGRLESGELYEFCQSLDISPVDCRHPWMLPIEESEHYVRGRASEAADADGNGMLSQEEERALCLRLEDIVSSDCTFDSLSLSQMERYLVRAELGFSNGWERRNSGWHKAGGESR